MIRRPTVTRLNTGIYKIHHAGRTFEVEQFPDRTWLLFEIYGQFEDRHYWRDFWTKREAVAAVAEFLA